MKGVIAKARAEGRAVLFEHELLDLLQTLGRPVPGHLYWPIASMTSVDELQKTLQCCDFIKESAVLKIVSPQILHKSDLGCVQFLHSPTAQSVFDAANRMLSGLSEALRASVAGFLLEEAIPFEAQLGHELLLGLRHSAEFGPVMTVGFGGTSVEALSKAFLEGQSTVLFSPKLTGEAALDRRLQDALFFKWVTGQTRGVKALCPKDAFFKEILCWRDAFLAIDAALHEDGLQIEEFELNPLVFCKENQQFMPVDALLRMKPLQAKAAEVPLAQLRAGLRPKSVALVGVSQRMNMGRIMLQAILAGGFDAAHLYVVKPGLEEIDGVRCVSGLAAIPEPVDLLVVAIGASAVPALLEEAFQTAQVKTVLLIPGGMGETESGKGIAQQIQSLVAALDPKTRPVLLGNNSVGMVSQPAHFDSLFIPEQKLPRHRDGLSGVALLSQSGAFMLTQGGKLDFLTFDYQISLGNQIDARVSDVLEALSDDPQVNCFALYLEGLQPGDGERLVAQIAKLRAQKKRVVIYKGGRSGLGAQATAGHTASVAGDYRIYETLLSDAGALMAGSLGEFQDLVRVCACLWDKTPGEGGVAFLSNAGYETVCLADHHGDLKPAKFAPETVQKIEEILKKAKLETLVSARNPLDVTPMAGDAVHAGCAEAILADPGVGCAVLGNVPFTAAVQSLPRGMNPEDCWDAPDGFAAHYRALFLQTKKPFVAVIDSGHRYDELAEGLQLAGIPTFRDGDRAILALSKWVQNALLPLG